MATKFNRMSTLSGAALVEQRANGLGESVKDSFEALILGKKKAIRLKEDEIRKMEDVSARNSQSLTVGDDVDPEEWANRRFEVELEIADLKYELETLNRLVKEYFTEDEGAGE